MLNLMPNQVHSAILIAGGKGSRMAGSGDSGVMAKGLVNLNHQTMVAIMATKLAGFAQNLWLNTNQELEVYARVLPDWRIYSDHPDFADMGPLAALASWYLLNTQVVDQWLLCLPCDMPLLPDDFAQIMLSGIMAQENQGAPIDLIVMPNQPLCMCVNTRILPSLIPFLQSGQRKVSDWQRQAQMCLAPVNLDFNASLNCNTPEDVLAAKLLLE